MGMVAVAAFAASAACYSGAQGFERCKLEIADAVALAVGLGDPVADYVIGGQRNGPARCRGRGGRGDGSKPIRRPASRSWRWRPQPGSRGRL
jgi:hypothetical protein